MRTRRSEEAVIGGDKRFQSEDFAAAQRPRVLAGNGIPVHFAGGGVLDADPVVRRH